MIKHASIILVATLLLLGTYQRNKTWKDSLTLWENTVGKAPLKARALNGLGLAYSDRGSHDKAIEILNRAIEADPKHVKAYNNLAITYSKMGLYEKSIEHFNHAIKIRPSYAKA